MAHLSDAELIAQSHNNIPRFCVDWPQVTWVLLILVFVWGFLGYTSMPQRKDPDVPVKTSQATCSWPGATPEQVELQLAYQIEQAIAQNSVTRKVYSQSTVGYTNVRVDLMDNIKEVKKEWADIFDKLQAVQNLPQGAGPIQYNSDFGDTAALMLTVASPVMKPEELRPRAKEMEAAIRQTRAARKKVPADLKPFTLVVNFPTAANLRLVEGPAVLAITYLTAKEAATDLQLIEGPGWIGLDGLSKLDDAALIEALKEFVRKRLQTVQLSPDAWQPCVIRDPAGTFEKLTHVAGAKYSYRELDDFTDLMQRTFRGPEIVSRVQRSGVQTQTVYLDYSQDRLAEYGVKPGDLADLLSARNITMSGGQVQADNTQLPVYPSGELKHAQEIENMVMTISSGGVPVYLRDLVTVRDGYQDPPTFLNFLTMRDAEGVWQRLRGITLAIQMKSHQQINMFGPEIDVVLEKLKKSLPADLVIDKTSNQPEQVKQKVQLLMTSLWKAIVLVVIVSLIGFWDWRSALLMALSVPITLSMTFGMMFFVGIDIQQVSIATLIIALGLLVDDPVVAGDAIKHGMGEGLPRLTASWLGPTKLAEATTFATITNIVAYLPFLGITGDIGEFLYSLPVTMTCALVASRIASMTFVPFLGSIMLRPLLTPPVEELRKQGFYAFYTRTVSWAIHHRVKFVLGGLAFIFVGFVALTRMPTAFFPTDLNPMFYVDVWAPENCSLAVTNAATVKAEEIIRDTCREFEREKGYKEGELLHSIATYVGGGSPRFWNTLSPQQAQLNYAQVTVNLTDEDFTAPVVFALQDRLSRAAPGVTMDVRQLQTGKPVDMPVQIRITGPHIPTLRALSIECQNIFRKIPLAARTRDDWGADSFSVDVDTHSARANMSGFTNYDVASSSYAGLSGAQVGAMRVGRKVIPIATRLQVQDRSQLSDIDNLYVYSKEGSEKVPLGQLSSVKYKMVTSRIQRRWQQRCITVGCFPIPGHLSSEVMKAARPHLEEFFARLPVGYGYKIDGDQHQQDEGFKNLVQVMMVSILLIYLSLVFQFKNAIKPFIVAAAVPFGIVGAIFGLTIMNVPFGFMSFLGIISLMGVIVSHIIVLFDYIEEAHSKGDDFENAIIDAGIMRLRPVMITIGATITALFPLAIDGGPLWQPLCYAQIGGLGVAAFVTLLVVPVIYTIFVTDLKWVKWETAPIDDGMPTTPVSVN
ncbi:MAG: efflux RND transporter permease subunit [Armatimonadetes bacterium]|nr:efflux RND transporter permease subunit [Armatimonadota bacterium]